MSATLPVILQSARVLLMFRQTNHILEYAHRLPSPGAYRQTELFRAGARHTSLCLGVADVQLAESQDAWLTDLD